MSPRATLRATFVGVVAACLVTACASGPVPTTSSSPAAASSATRSASTDSEATGSASASVPEPVESTVPTPSKAASCSALAASLTTDQKVGQLFMVGTTSTRVPDSLASVVTEFHLGSVLYLGARNVGVAGTAVQSMEIAALGEGGIPVLIAADQEGGLVQRLQGTGFSTIPSARVQGQMDADRLRSSWAAWGTEMKRAGVRYNLAPVADTVPSSLLADNAPIGALRRNFGSEPGDVAVSVESVVKGLSDAHVATAVKHFPGLGRVTTNTDFGVAVDDRTTADDSFLKPFSAAMNAGVSSVMVSSAIYSKIDPGVPAVHSAAIVTGLLRQKLGWQGVVISDDLGAAASVGAVPNRERGVRFIAAGGDIVIDADPTSIEAMVGGVLDRVASDRGFADGLDEHVTRVLELKASLGLVECG